MSTTMRQAGVALRLLVVMTVLLGIVYPAALWAVGRIVPSRADGSFVTAASGTVVGSSLIGQDFQGPQWFHPRPSAAGKGYDALSSSGSNLAADNKDLVDAVTQRKADAATALGIAPSAVPADAVTASGSGLDPDISPEYAAAQIASVAKARNLSVEVVTRLVDEHTTGRTLGFIGEPRVNVLELNLALEQMR
ncbi:MAG TPA: potassium-transporting ATPase subunit KdpC [Candidatus Nanopelagicales bacterium]